MSENSNNRIDPTLLLPDEPMSYEIKQKKKKKKKKKKDMEDPLGDLEGMAIDMPPEPVKIEYDYNSMQGLLDPEVTIKEENIEVDLDFNDFGDTDGLVEDIPTEDTQMDQPVDIKTDIKTEACILTFENIIKDVKKEHKKSKLQKMCNICHLVFKSNRTLRIHQLKKHAVYRASFVHACDHCGMAYEHKTSLETHIKRKHSTNSVEEDHEQRVCEICALVFKGMPRLRMHMQRKHGTYSDTFKHKCRDCGLTYDKYHSLMVHRRRKHMNVKEKRQWFKCPLCPKIFGKRDAYSRHVIRKHHSNHEETKLPKEILDSLNEANMNVSLTELPCKHCPLVFSSVMHLKLHMRRKHGQFKEDFQLKCFICDLSYDKVESLKRHIRRKHGGTFCETCNKQFQSEEEFANHTHERPIIECSICGLIFASQGGLSKHLRCTHKIDLPKTVFCHLCKEGFQQNRQLKIHIMRVHLNINYPCKHCKKVFKTGPSLRKHALKFHPVQGLLANVDYNCTVCPETFTSEHELCKHINSAHKSPVKSEAGIKVESESYQCTKCDHNSPTWVELRQHYEQNHHNLPSVQCQSCGDFILERDMPKHMKNKHPVETIQKCPYCDFETASKSSLTQHTLRHKNATTINCDYQGCKYKSYYQIAMDKHKKRHAEIGTKLQCASCPFQTMNKYILRYHEEEHATGKKRYECNQCDYKTILPANLVQHKYKHAAEKRFKCESCPFASKYNTSLRFHVRKKHCDLPTKSV